MHENWGPAPAAQRTQKLETMTTIVLCKGLSKTSGLLQENRNYPYKYVAWPWHPDEVDTIKADASCPRRLDAFTEASLVKYPNFRYPAAKMYAISINVNGREDTLESEKGNGLLHRFLVQKNNGKRSVGATGLNLFFVQQHMKWDQREALKEVRRQERVVEAQAKRAQQLAQPPRKRKLLEWNMFEKQEKAAASEGKRPRPSRQELSAELGRR